MIRRNDPSEAPHGANRIKPKQSLGQNFLIDENIVRNIIRDFRLSVDDVVLEIGAGLGALTRELAGAVRHLIVVEIDRRAIQNLQEAFGSPAVSILHKDFLDVSLAYQKRLYKSKLRLIGNIPYHLTSPILFKVFEERKVVRDLTIMVQREVARRIVARPGSKEYGITSVLAQFFGEPRIFFDVSPNCFYPKPKVTSSVLHVRLYDALPHRVDAELFRLIVRTAFGKRRKTLRNSLKFLPYDEDTVNRIIQQIDFPTEKRPEQLSVAQFAQLTDQIAQILL